MPKSSAQRKPVIVHPAAESRIERAATKLTGHGDLDKATVDALIERHGVRPLEAALKTAKEELNARICTLIKIEGEADDEGKVRYETDLHKFQVIPGKNVYIDEGKLRAAMTSFGMTPKQINNVLVKSGAMKVTEYEYPGVYKQKEKAEARS